MSISLTLTNLTTNTSRSITSIIDGDTYSWRIDDSLDSGVLMYIDNDLTPVEPFTLATITFDNGSSEKMWVAEDSVQMVSKIGNNKSYQHTLKLIELTKILEKIVITGLCMTPTDKEFGTPMYNNLQAQFTKCLEKINIQSGNVRLETINNFDSSYLMYRSDVETFIFNNSTAREILDEICSAVDSRVVVDDVVLNYTPTMLVVKVNYMRMTPTTEVVLGEDTHHTLISESASNSVESYAGEVFSHVESALSGNEIRFQDTFKANDAIATSNNRVMSLPYAIQYPTSFKIKSTTAYVSVKGTYYIAGDSATHTFTTNLISVGSTSARAWFDALDYFVDYEYWQTLSLSDQQKTLYYQRGQAEVDVSRTYKSLIVTKSVFSTMFTDLLNDWYTANESEIFEALKPTAQASGGTLTSVQKTGVYSGDIDDIIFDIAYVGEIEGLATSVKQADRTFFERNLMVVDGQRASVIDIERYGQNLKGKINRLGNNLVYIDCNVDSYSNILPLMTKLTDYDNGVIYQVDISRHTDSETWYEVRYYIAKDFNNLNERIALRKEKRIYAIPTKGYQVILPDRETVVIDNYQADHNSISLGATSADQRATTCWSIMQAAMGGTGIVSNAFVKVDIDPDAGLDYQNFVLPVTGYGSGNTINFVCKFYDNASAGLSIDTSSYGGINWLGGKKVCYNKYTNDYGYTENPTVEWGYFPNERTTQGVKAQPKLLLSGTGAETTGTYFKSDYIGFKKDPSEALCFQKIIRIETAKPSIIIGRFVDYNSLYQDFSNKNIYIYYQTTDRDPYKLGDKKVRYNTLNGDTRVSVLGAMGVEGENYISLVKNNLNNVDKYNIAIGDEDGNMFIASNGLCSGSTLFTFYKKESIG